MSEQQAKEGMPLITGGSSCEGLRQRAAVRDGVGGIEIQNESYSHALKLKITKPSSSLKTRIWRLKNRTPSFEPIDNEFYFLQFQVIQICLFQKRLDFPPPLIRKLLDSQKNL